MTDKSAPAKEQAVRKKRLLRPEEFLDVRFTAKRKIMVNRKAPGSNLTPAQQRARDAFRPPVPPRSAADIEKQAFEENRERLKALRLARDAETKRG